MLKRILYSNVTRLIAYWLIVICVASGVYATGVTFATFHEIYAFEKSYEESNMLFSKLHSSSKIIMDALVKQIEPFELQGLMSDKNVIYYAAFGEYIYSNGEFTEESFPKDGSGVFISCKNGNTTVKKSGYKRFYFDSVPQGDYVLFVRLTDDFDEICQGDWNRGRSQYESLFYIIAVLAFAVILLFIYLVYACGRKKDGSYSELRIDSVFNEFSAAAFIFFTTILFEVLVNLTINSIQSRQFLLLYALFCGILAALSFLFIMPVIRNIKNHKFLDRCFAVYIYRKFSMFIKKHASRKPLIITMVVFIIYTLLIIIFQGGALSFLLMTLCCVFLAKNLEDAEAITKGISEIKAGNISYKIPELKGVFSKIAEDINSIGDGIEAAVEKQIKSERMKSALITNVSHDIKTPLTSVIGYSELLCKETLTPKEANDYAKVILQKANRLKSLTADLFDISKVQSGNETIQNEKINLSFLVKQTLAELDEEIRESAFEICTEFDENAYVTCDGRKMSRVFENLFRNALKYAMPNTRIFIEVVKKNRHVSAFVKNISSYKMDFSGDEITERFVRGDKSRTGDGSGLGLAIAKSYTEACGGRFNITIDGDLFKAEICFDDITSL